MKEIFKNIDFESEIRNKLDGFEYSQINPSWGNFKKSLPHKGIPSYLYIIVATGGIALLSVIGYLTFTNNPDHKITFRKNTPEIVLNNDLSENQNSINNTNSPTEKKIQKANNIVSVEKKESNCVMTESNVSEHKDNIKFEKSNVVTEKISIEHSNNNTNPIQPSGNFNISSTEGCNPLTISLLPEEISDSIVYYWDFGNGDFSNEIKPDYTYTKEGKYSISLTVKYFHSEKQLTIFYPQKVVVFSSPVADFSWSSDEPEYRFKSDCQDCDNIWNIDEELYFGETVNLRFELEKTYKISLVSENIYGCKDTIVKNIENTNEFKIHIPTGFTPDNDNVNDLFGPVIYNIGDRKYLLSIYSGKGQLVFQSNDINYQWNGKIMNSQQNADPGIYFWEIFLNSESGDSVKKAGHVTLIR